MVKKNSLLLSGRQVVRCVVMCASAMCGPPGGYGKKADQFSSVQSDEERWILR
jgi:hypothetical protein